MNKNILIGAVGILAIVAILVLPKGKHAPVVTTEPKKEDATGIELYNEATKLKKEGDVVKAKELYQAILTDHSDFNQVEQVQKDLETLNLELIFSNTPVEGKTVFHTVGNGDTLGELAKKYGTTVELIQKSNNLTNNMIRVGQKLRIWTGVFNIVVDKSQNILILKDGNDVLKVYKVSTGSNNSTPVGEFTIISRLVDPVWFNKGIVVPPESPQNVLGSRWLGFDLPGYGIHGTIEPETIGQQVTAGCVRMRNEDVEELYSIIPRGTKVVIVD